jgi:hypothetical protein
MPKGTEGFERFDAQARRAVVLAQEEAAEVKQGTHVARVGLGGEVEDGPFGRGSDRPESDH